MSVIVMYNKKKLLKSSNVIFRGFYTSIIKYVEKSNSEFSKNITNLIKDLESGCRGIGLDIADYILEKKDFLIFTDIVKNSLNELYIDIPDLSYDYKEMFENFYQELQKQF